MKKYELALETASLFAGGETYHIRALKDFETIWGNKIKAGDLGGRVESEKNLSQDGKCWIGYKSKVTGNAAVCEDAMVTGTALVYGNSKVFGSAVVGGDIDIGGESQICGSTIILGN